ncbi:MAG: hypothetical protein MK207_14015 [Saprospiraceae bacterium]|nr:hypothetical protein [Saprospiraceae bacterium]
MSQRILIAIVVSITVFIIFKLLGYEVSPFIKGGVAGGIAGAIGYNISQKKKDNGDSK